MVWNRASIQERIRSLQTSRVALPKLQNMDKILFLVRILASLTFIHYASATVCPGILSQGIQCVDNGGNEVDCANDLPIGSQAKCKPFYTSSSPQSSCGHDGWTATADLKCQLVCGKSKEGNGQDRPFGASLYQVMKKEFNSRICAATLISDGFVITIAHCLLDHKNKVLDTEILRVGLGPVANETIYTVKNVDFATNSSQIGPDDLVILTLENFTMSADVIPACLPTCGLLDEVALRDGSTGEMYARGQIPQKLKVKVTANCTDYSEFCAGNPFSDKSFKKCPEEIGTGITISMGEETLFIYGILSSTPNPSCSKFRTFKRIFPFINWIRTVAKLDDLPQTRMYSTSTVSPAPTAAEVNDISTTVTLPAPEVNTIIPEIDLPSAYFQEISKERQVQMTNLTIKHQKIQIDVLLNSLKFSKKLKNLEIVESELSSGFTGLEELPEIENYILKDVRFNERPTHFQGYFPFFQLNSTNFNSLKLISIDDDYRRFYLKPDLGRLIVSNFQNFSVDRILNESSYPWKRLSLEETLFNYTSIPSTLEHLSLSKINITSNEMSMLLTTKLRDLESLAINELYERELKLEDIPTDSLHTLRLDRVNLTFSSAPQEDSTTARSWLSFSSKPVSDTPIMYPTFEKLETFYWGVDVSLGDPIIAKFSQIFPNLRQVAYFGRNDLTVLNKILELKKLKILYLRIQDVGSDEAKQIMKKVEFNPGTNATQAAKIINVCVEPKAAQGNESFDTNYLGSDSALFNMTAKFPDGFDIPECVFDG